MNEIFTTILYPLARHPQDSSSSSSRFSSCCSNSRCQLLGDCPSVGLRTADYGLRAMPRFAADCRTHAQRHDHWRVLLVPVIVSVARVGESAPGCIWIFEYEFWHLIISGILHFAQFAASCNCVQTRPEAKGGTNKSTLVQCGNSLAIW